MVLRIVAPGVDNLLQHCKTNIITNIEKLRDKITEFPANLLFFAAIIKLV
jgi:hypothetical protein